MDNNLNEILFNSAFEESGFEKLAGLLKWEEYFKDLANLEVKHPVYKCTPLWIACNMGNVKQVELLLEKGADKESFGENGKTCVEVVEENLNEDSPEYQQILDLLNKEWNDDNKETVKDLSVQLDELKKTVSKLKSENKNLLIENSQINKELEDCNQDIFQKEVKISILENSSKDFNLKKDEYEIQLGFLKERNETNNKLIENYIHKEESYNQRILDLSSKEEKYLLEIKENKKSIDDLKEQLERALNPIVEEVEIVEESSQAVHSRKDASSSDVNHSDLENGESIFYKLANNPNKLVFQIPVKCFSHDSYYKIYSGTLHQDYQEIWNARLLGLWYGFTSLKKTQCNPQIVKWENSKGEHHHQSFINNIDFSNGVSSDLYIEAPKGKNLLYRLKFELENGIIMESKVFFVPFV
eukprot:TRINITY_DN3076_c0_g1_i1.p1 TRINITY_DN3076_c0_g1~~TRINITY_DN3076_c0_g1_i1.p1  ORF type:complete len:420 (-),score=137.34 TRINITY_DN3076_c0_g1_i1:39-1277(-)